MNVTFVLSERSRLCLLLNPGILRFGIRNTAQRILRFGIRNTAQRIRNSSKDWKLESKLTVPHTVPGIPRIRSVESGHLLSF